MTWMLYGANGYTGRLIALAAHEAGERPILAGRRAEAVAPVAERHGFEYRVFSLDAPAAVARALGDVAAVLLAAGPFSATSAPVIEACLTTGVHYLDITGEVDIFEQCHARDDRAVAAGIVVLPGVGFDVVPSDCLAASLAAALPGARTLELAFASTGAGGPQVSAGTAKTMLEGLGRGGAVREDGRIRTVPLGYRPRRIPFRDRARDAVAIRWGDVSTAYYSTGIPNIIVYAATPRRQVRAMRVLRYLAPLVRLGPVRRAIARRIEQTVPGPDEHARRTVRAQLWGRVADGTGRAVEGTLVTPEGYALTARTAVESMRRVLAGRAEPGFRTPSLAFGAGFITEFEGCDLRIRDSGSGIR